MRPRWCGYWDQKATYGPGDVIVRLGGVYMAKEIVISGAVWDAAGSASWVWLGKQENCKIDHYYYPEGIAFPLPSGDLSETTYVCSDCWKNNNFAAAFMPDEHAYMIQELP